MAIEGAVIAPVTKVKILVFKDMFTSKKDVQKKIAKWLNKGYEIKFEHLDVPNRVYFLRLERTEAVEVCQECNTAHKDINEAHLCPTCQDVKDMGAKLWDDLEAVNADNPVDVPSIQPVAVPMPMGYGKGIENDPFKMPTITLGTIQFDRTKPVTITAGEDGASIGLGSSNGTIVPIDPSEPVLNLVQKHGADAVIANAHSHLEEIGKKVFADSMKKTEGLSGQELLSEVLNVQFS